MDALPAVDRLLLGEISVPVLVLESPGAAVQPLFAAGPIVRVE